MITWKPKMCIGCNARPAVLGTWTIEGFELLHCDRCGTPCDPECCDVSMSPDAETITALWLMHCAAPPMTAYEIEKAERWEREGMQRAGKARVRWQG